MQPIKHQNLGIVKYTKAWDYQEVLFANLLSQRNIGEQAFFWYILPSDYQHIYTLNKPNQTSKKNRVTYPINYAGSSIIYTGFDKINTYPTFNFEFFNLTLKENVLKYEGASENIYDANQQRVEF